MLSTADRSLPRWSPGNALRFAWRTFAGNPLFFIGAVVADDFVYRGLEVASSWLDAQRVPRSDMIVFVLDSLVGTLISVVSIRLALKFSDGQGPTVDDLRPRVTSILRFLAASVPYWCVAVGAMIAFSAASVAIIAEYAVVRSGRGALPLGLALGIGIAAVGAVALVVTLRLVWWLADRQFYGHFAVDKNLWPAAAFRGSTSLARPVRWQLLGLISSFIPVGLVLGFIKLIIMENPPSDPSGRFHFPHIAIGWPASANDAVVWMIGSLAALAAWLFLLAVSFAYRTLSAKIANQSHDSPGPFSTGSGGQSTKF